MDYRGKYPVCNVCPVGKNCAYCSGGYRNDLNSGSRSHHTNDIDIVDVAIGVGLGLAVDELLEEIFD